jgi:LuxR family maltose regulon positive regulatory protein
MGDLLREWNDLDSAEGYLRQGMTLVPDTLTVGADVVTLGHLALARLLQARGASSEAQAVLDAFAFQARERGFADHLIVRAAAVQAQLWLAQDNLPTALHWAETSGVSVADEPDNAREAASFAYEGAYLTVVRVVIAQGRANPSAQHLTAALDVLERLLQAAEAGARMHSVIEILSLRALAHYTRSNLPDALAALTRALVLAEPDGYVRVFLDAGVPMAELLAQVAARTSPVAAYATRLLETFARAEDRGLRAEAPAPARSAFSPESSTLVEPLSAREREVLQLIAAGKSNAQIAQALVVAVSTVKAHVNHLFGKLAVTSRTQAIARAHELHLL